MAEIIFHFKVMKKLLGIIGKGESANLSIVILQRFAWLNHMTQIPLYPLFACGV